MSFRKNLFKVKEFFLDILFPKYCLNCGKEGNYLCQDCFSLIDVANSQYCPFCQKPKVVFDGKTCGSCRRSKNLAGLYCATSYNNFILKKLVNQFKYEPYVKELAKPLSSLIVAHLININVLGNFSGFILVPVPLYKKKLKYRGFNPAEEIAKELSENLKIPLLNKILSKTKSTPAQVELKKEEREKNIKGVFSCQNSKLVEGRKILLTDDIFTTGSTLEECAKVLKSAGAKEVWGIVTARG